MFYEMHQVLKPEISYCASSSSEKTVIFFSWETSLRTNMINEILQIQMFDIGEIIAHLKFIVA